MARNCNTQRVLIISHSIPCFPGAGAETRAFCLTRELSKSFAITFLLPDYGEANESRLEALRDIVQVETYPVDKQWYPLEWRLRRVFMHLERLHPYCFLDTWPSLVRDVRGLFPGLQRKLNSLDWTDVDLSHLIHPHLTPALERTGNDVLKTLDWVDERSIALIRNLQADIPAHTRIAGMLEVNRIRWFQARTAPLFDASFVASEVDADRLQSCIGGYRPVVVPNGVDLGYFHNTLQGKPDGNILVFTGHMSYEPNVDAVLYFCRQILPAIVAKVPGTHLLVVGMQPHPSVLALEHECPGIVTVTGEIADVRPYLAQSSVSIVPLRSGSGTRLKILEAMAMRRPVVSTAIGCEGLVAKNDRHLLIRDDPAEFAQAVINLLNDTGKWNQLANAGRELVEEHYGWNVLAGLMARTWQNLIESKTRYGATV